MRGAAAEAAEAAKAAAECADRLFPNGLPAASSARCLAPAVRAPAERPPAIAGTAPSVRLRLLRAAPRARYGLGGGGRPVRIERHRGRRG